MPSRLFGEIIVKIIAGLPGRGEANLEEKSKDELVALIDDLKNTLQTRESQLETKFQEVANMQDVTHQLMVSSNLEKGLEQGKLIPTFPFYPNEEVKHSDCLQNFILCLTICNPDARSGSSVVSSIPHVRFEA